ncbi:uncharacterized protein LOC134261888, partial [Saccostrea cucullata]|uniref:uncharacterized protein LOC134261888 n=1 Tax=Saccostrea cuccullata TaxID=36930 RepID=UPI002ED2700F
YDITICGFGYDLDTIRCVLSDVGVPVWVPSQLSSSFTQKVCLFESNSRPTSWPQQTTEIFKQQQTTGTTEPQTTEIFKQQQTTGTTDPQTTEIFKQQQTTGTTDPQTTEIFKQQQTTGTTDPQTTDVLGQQQTTGKFRPQTTEIFQQQQTLESSRQQTTGISVQPVIKTTEQSHTTEKSLQQKTTIQHATSENRIITNGSVQCTCVCMDTTLSLQEKLKQRKSDLTVNSKILSSRLRKLTSAPDFRLLSCAIGSVGAIVIGVIVAVIVLPDVYQTVSYIIKIFYCKLYNLKP